MRNQNHLIDLIQFIHLSDAYDLLIQLIYIICLESFSPEAPVSPDLPGPDLFDSTDPHYACCSPFLPDSPDQPSPPHVSSPRCSVQNNITVEMEIALSAALEQIGEVEGIGNDDNDDDDDADFVPLEDS